MRPMRSTAVASITTRPAREMASCIRCCRCQSVALPSSAEYWHIGATAMRLGSSIGPSASGANKWVTAGYPIAWGDRTAVGAPTMPAPHPNVESPHRSAPADMTLRRCWRRGCAQGPRPPPPLVEASRARSAARRPHPVRPATWIGAGACWTVPMRRSKPRTHRPRIKSGAGSPPSFASKARLRRRGRGARSRGTTQPRVIPSATRVAGDPPGTTPVVCHPLAASVSPNNEGLRGGEAPRANFLERLLAAPRRFLGRYRRPLGLYTVVCLPPYGRGGSGPLGTVRLPGPPRGFATA